LTAKRHDEKEIVAGMQTKTRARPYAKCCVVEQKSESKGKAFGSHHFDEARRLALTTLIVRFTDFLLRKSLFTKGF